MADPHDELIELLNSIPVAERGRRFREMAAQALEQATATVDPETKAGLINLATKWHALALEMERAQSGQAEPPSSQP